MVINISDLENVKFNNNDVEVLVVNGVKVWEKLKDDLSFNYIGVDINGRYDGAVDYDGTPVEYYIGEYTYTYLKELSYIPTTAEEYYDKYVQTVPDTKTGFTKITSSNISTYVTVGTTIAYDITDKKEDAYGYLYSPIVCGGFNGDYYNYDFSTYVSPSDPSQQIIPDDIVIPETYKGKPITNIINNAFDAGLNYVSSGGASQWNGWSQAIYIKSVKLPSTLTQISASGFHLLEQLTKDIEFPEGIEFLMNNSFSNCAQPSKKYILPKSVNLALNTNSLVWDGISSMVNHNNVYTIVIQSPNVELMATANAFRYAKNVEFTKDVQSITGCLGYNGLPTNLVFRHSNSDAITLSLSKPKSATAVNIYTDNDVIRNYDWASMNYTATFYPLSEYVE